MKPVRSGVHVQSVLFTALPTSFSKQYNVPVVHSVVRTMIEFSEIIEFSVASFRKDEMRYFVLHTVMN